MLLTQKYAKLGALVNFPIILNIFIITLSYNFKGTSIITGLMLFANIILIFWDWNDFKVLINKIQKKDNRIRIENDMIWVITGSIIFTFTLVYRIINDSYNFGFWFINCLIVGFVGFLIGLIKEKIRRKRKL